MSWDGRPETPMYGYWLQELVERVMKALPAGGHPLYPGAMTFTSCIFCGKSPHYDYAGLCTDCADGLGLSYLFPPNYHTGVSSDVTEGLPKM